MSRVTMRMLHVCALAGSLSILWGIYGHLRARDSLFSVRGFVPQLGWSNSQHVNIPDFDYSKTEEIFLSIPSPDSARSASKAWTRKPHLAGSENDYNSALEQLKVFQNHLGIRQSGSLPIFEAGSRESRDAVLSIPNITEPKVWIDTYYPLLDMPGERHLEILNADGGVVWSADLEERYAEGDPAGQWHNAVGAWHALSKGGDVKGKLVYANYGDQRDFEALVAAGYNLTGAIVLVRYGIRFRGLQVKAAYEAGAAGCLIYDDPRADHPVTSMNGYKTWPEGPARNPHAIQRGHVLDISLYSGDPSTPGYPAYRNASRTNNTNIPSIPSLPISWANAQVLLNELASTGKNISERDIRLANNVNHKVRPIWNVMTAVPGSIRDEVVIVGNHRDAWVLGAADPTSGTVSMQEVSKGLGELLRQGWKPLRTIIMASWDGEEYGLFGSTEWGEDFQEWLQKNVVAYLNVDKSTSGRALRLRGTPSLAHLYRQAALDLPHYSDPKRTLWDAREDKGPYLGPANQTVVSTRKRPRATMSTGIRPLGSGSDYTVFIQRLGIAVADSAFSGASGDAVHHYHSLWDSAAWMEEYGDPNYLRHVALAKHWGLVLLRLSDSFILPLNTTQYALELDAYLKRVEGLLPTLPGAPDITGLRNAIRYLQAASQNLDNFKSQTSQRLTDLITSSKNHAYVQHAFDLRSNSSREDLELMTLVRNVTLINEKLSGFERGFISEEGLPGREWYRHLIVAPGKWKGYGATTLPALTEAITLDHNATLAALEVERLTTSLRSLADRLNEGL